MTLRDHHHPRPRDRRGPSNWPLLGTVFMQSGFGGTVSWAQVPAYVIGELVGGVLGGLAYVFIGRVRADAAMTSLAPDADPVPQKVSGAAS